MISIGLHNHHGFLLHDVEVPEGPERDSGWPRSVLKFRNGLSIIAVKKFI